MANDPVSIDWEFIRKTAEEVRAWPEWKKLGWDIIEQKQREDTYEKSNSSYGMERA